MHGLRFLHTRLSKACPEMYLKRLVALLKGVEAVVWGAPLTLTGMGRGLRSPAFAKHNIKRMDRLLGNGRLHEERLGLYGAMAAWLLRLSARVVVVVDGSDCPDRRYLMLKAAVPVGGRALALYHEVHRLGAYKQARVHRRFVQRLKRILPVGCRVIVVTDAGFQRPWFREVERLGWDWVGRLCEPVHYRRQGKGAWQPISRLYHRHGRARELGVCELAKSAPYVGRVCVARPAKKYRADRPLERRHGHGTVDKRIRKLYSTPWVLGTSLGVEAATAQGVIGLYEQRMQIEETFRDIKSARFGYAMEYTRSRDAKRLELLLLIGALAMMVQWMLGLAGELRGLSRHFQANTVTNKRVLSLLFLGGELMKSQRFKLSHTEFKRAMNELPALIARQALPA